ncbi:MAG TPA: SpoIIE family protein phosphatase [Methylomirabilota bacterium]|nr:SpoIIE family protein phosphatase [Methylomirabilota bacterium]
MSAAPRILVVDDETGVTTVLSATLKRAGYHVATASDGLEALETIRRQPPDLVLLDVMMPGPDGFETLSRIREHGPTAQLPVIMLTAKTALADKMKGFERGADDYVVKPFAPAEVLARVQALLRRTDPMRVMASLVGELGARSSAETLAQLGRDLKAARDIHARLLPAPPALVAGLAAGAVLRPASVVGGDFFDLIPMGERVGVAVGDVAGKGIPAALLMVMVRTLLREISASLVEPSEVLAWLNASLCRDIPPSMFVTLVLAVLDPARPGQIVVSNAGHPPPVLYRRAAAPQTLALGGMVLGVSEEAVFDQTELKVGSGDGMVLYTDGVVGGQEADGRHIGLSELMDLLGRERDQAAPALAQTIVDDALRRGGGRAEDDMAVVVLQCP